MTTVRAAAESHTGYVRSSNQDLAVVSRDLFAVADGMGGHAGGDVAARTAIEELVGSFEHDRSVGGLVAAAQQANRAVWQRATVEGPLRGMGTTLTAVALVADPGGAALPHLVLVNIGDSRAYQLDVPADGHRELRRLTEDHSVAEEMVRQGDLTPAEAAVHPHRHVLTRALGIDSEADLDVFDLEPALGTRILLCSDGLTDDVPEEEIGEVLSAVEEPADAARELVRRALDHGGRDNVTVVVIDVVEGSPDEGDHPLLMVPPVPPDDGIEQSDVAGITASMPAVRSGGPGITAKTPATGASTGEGIGAAGGGAGPFDQQAAGAAGVGVVGAAGNGSIAPGPRSMTMTAARPRPRGGRDDEDTDSFPGVVPRSTLLVPAKSWRKRYRDRIFSVRVFLFLVLLVALAAGVVGVAIWFQRNSYFVGLSGDRVSIYQGRPGGLMWFKPQLVRRSTLSTSELLPNSVEDLRRGITESSYSSAEAELRSLQHLSKMLGLYGSGRSSAATSYSHASTSGGTPA